MARSMKHSDAFAANPIGVEIDSSALLAQYRNGIPMEALLVPPEGPISQIPPEHGLS